VDFRLKFMFFFIGLKQKASSHKFSKLLDQLSCSNSVGSIQSNIILVFKFFLEMADMVTSDDETISFYKFPWPLKYIFFCLSLQYETNCLLIKTMNIDNMKSKRWIVERKLLKCIRA